MGVLFNLNTEPELMNKVALSDVINNVSDSKMAPLPEPVSKSTINVIKSFKWTKTIRNNNNDFLENNIPSLSLREYYVTQPGFVSNIQNILESFPGAITGLVTGLSTAAGAALPDDSIFSGLTSSFKNLMGNIEQSSGYQDSVGENIKTLGNIKSAATNIIKSIALNSSGIPTGDAAYMKSYENIYGVLESRFRYLIPYFATDWKSINNSWENVDMSSASKYTKSLSGALDIAKQVTLGFNIDYAKYYKYGSNNPSTKLSFYLDNTFDSFTNDANSYAQYQKNWELIFLLLYQNLPNRRNRLFNDPPVIYKATVPGVFTYLYSYISSISVECYGNRQPLTVNLDVVGPGARSSSVKTLIPEAFKVNLEITSLLPETKNLFLHSLQDKITTSKE